MAARNLLLTASIEQLKGRPLVPGMPDLMTFLQSLIGFDPLECLVILYLDVRGHLICHEVLAQGGIDSAPFDIRRIILRALNTGCSGLLVVHNHPSGDPQPSKADIRATRRLSDAAREFSLTVHDHLVVARGRCRSAMHPERQLWAEEDRES